MHHSNLILKRSIDLVQQFGTVNMASIHGPSHWRNVEANGAYLAKLEGQDPLIPQLFALFHDFLRVNDGRDPEHGPRAAAFLRVNQSLFPELSNQELEILAYACEGHTWEKLRMIPWSESAGMLIDWILEEWGLCRTQDSSAPRQGAESLRIFLSLEITTSLRGNKSSLKGQQAVFWRFIVYNFESGVYPQPRKRV